MIDVSSWYKGERSEPQADLRKTYTKSINVKPLRWEYGVALFGAVALLGLGVGVAIGTQIFMGAVMLTGLIAISERDKRIKYLVLRSNKNIDIMIFIGSVVAIATLGPTLAGSLTVAGLGYTLVYAPFIRNQYQKQKQNENN